MTALVDRVQDESDHSLKHTHNMSQNNNNKWRHYTHLFLEKILTISQSFQTILFLLKFYKSDIFKFEQ